MRVYRHADVFDDDAPSATGVACPACEANQQHAAVNQGQY